MNSDQNMNINEPNSEKKAAILIRIPSDQVSDVPLFLQDRSDGQKGDAQDEKDKTGE